MKTKELKTGDEIKIKNGFELIKSSSDRVNSTRIALDSLAESLRVNSDDLWKTIHAFYPEIEGWICGLKYEGKELTIQIKYKEIK